MEKRSRTVFVGTLLGVLALALTAAVGPAAAPAAADGKRKLTQREWKKLMNGWARELGVKCHYCHVKQGDEYDYDADTPNKAIAHYCEENFVEKLQLRGKPVSCVDCHQRKAQFLPRPAEDEGGEDSTQEREGK